MARKFGGKKITQLRAFGFDKVGDAHEGTFTGTKETQITDADGTRDATIILLQPDEGERFGVWANSILVDMMQGVKSGTYIKITHTAVGEAKGKRSPPKLFEIEIAE